MSKKNQAKVESLPLQSLLKKRTVAEWTTLLLSLAILLVLVALITYQYLHGGDQPARIEVYPQIGSVVQNAGAYYLPVEIKNLGDQTAEEVWVELSLTGDQGTVEKANFMIIFLDGGATSMGMAVYDQDPAKGQLTVDMSFVRP
jgi:uncharacterized protein (TIGR02588 family)